jgi:tRNA U55 pseudouridine synthase TruB
MGCGAHLSTLRRLDSGRFSVADAIPLADLLAMNPKQVEDKVIPFSKLALA